MCLKLRIYCISCLPRGSDGKESTCSTEDLGWIPGSGRSPGEANSYLLQHSWWRSPWTVEPGGLHSLVGCKKLEVTERLSKRQLFSSLRPTRSKGKAKDGRRRTVERVNGQLTVEEGQLKGSMGNSLPLPNGIRSLKWSCRDHV